MRCRVINVPVPQSKFVLWDRFRPCWHVIAWVWCLPLKLSITKDDITAETGLTILKKLLWKRHIIYHTIQKPNWCLNELDSKPWQLKYIRKDGGLRGVHSAGRKSEKVCPYTFIFQLYVYVCHLWCGFFWLLSNPLIYEAVTICLLANFGLSQRVKNRAAGRVKGRNKVSGVIL